MHRAVRRQHHVFAHHVANDCANRLHHSSNPSQPLDALDPEDAQMLQVAPAFMQHPPYQMLPDACRVLPRAPVAETPPWSPPSSLFPHLRRKMHAQAWMVSHTTGRHMRIHPMNDERDGVSSESIGRVQMLRHCRTTIENELKVCSHAKLHGGPPIDRRAVAPLRRRLGTECAPSRTAPPHPHAVAVPRRAKGA